jgi:hypothetical protein
MGRYQSKKMRDPRGQFIRLYNEIINSPAWICLSPSAVKLYIAMRSRLNGFNNGDISATLSIMKINGMRSSATLAKCLKELEVLGFIDKTRQGGIAAGGKFCSLYRFTDEQVYENPAKGIKSDKATNEWRNIKNKAHGEALLSEYLQINKKAKVLKLKQFNSKSEANSSLLNS